MASEQEAKQRGPQGEEPAAQTDDLEQQVEELLREVDASEKTLTATMADEPAPTDIDAAAMEAATELEQDAGMAVDASAAPAEQAGGEDMESLVDELLASVNSGDATAEIPPAVVAAAPHGGEATAPTNDEGADAPQVDRNTQTTDEQEIEAPDVTAAAESTDASESLAEAATEPVTSDQTLAAEAIASADVGEATEVATPDALDAASEAANRDVSEAAQPEAASGEPTDDDSIPAPVSEVSEEAVTASVADAQAGATPDASLDALDAQIAASADEELANATPAQLLGVPETELAEALVKPATPAKTPEPAAVKTEVKPAEITHHAAKEKARQAAGRLGHALQPYVAKVAALTAKPLANKPKSVKSAAAMIAANTTLFATVFWGYLIFFRPTQPAAAQAEPFDFAKSGLPSPERHEEHGAHAAEGAHAEAKSSGGHGDAKGGKDGPKPLIDSKPKHLLNEVEAERAKASKGGKAEAKKGGH